MRSYSQRGFSSATWFDSLETLEWGRYRIPDSYLLKKLHRKLSLQYHPDKCGDCKGEMANINSAYEFIEENFGIGVACHRSALSESVNKTVTFFDMDITGHEDIVGGFLSDFGVFLY